MTVMTNYAIIRDDDINFFTSPKMLDKLYLEMFAMHIPTNLSIIPRVKTNIKIKNNLYSKLDGLKYEPFIPKEYHDKNLYFEVYENRELVQFIESIKEFIEVIQHGYSHSPKDFSSLNVIELKRKIIDGRKILKKTFDVTPKFFSAPYDAYSPISLLLLKKYFHGVTYGEFALKDMLSLSKLPFNMIPYYLNAIRRGDIFFVNDNFLMLGHKGVSTSPFIDINKLKYDFKECFKNQKIIVIMQHYWEYFYVKKHGYIGENINKELFNTVLEIVQWLKSQGTKFLTFSQFYKKIR